MNKLIVYTAVFANGDTYSTTNKAIGDAWNEMYRKPEGKLQVVGFTSSVVKLSKPIVKNINY